jgi:hypothetical protein
MSYQSSTNYVMTTADFQRVAGGTPLTKADSRPVRSSCWRCHGLERVWPDTHKYSYDTSVPCPACAGTGLEMIPFTELFVHDTKEGRRRGFKKWSEIRRA